MGFDRFTTAWFSRISPTDGATTRVRCLTTNSGIPSVHMVMAGRFFFFWIESYSGNHKVPWYVELWAQDLGR